MEVITSPEADRKRFRTYFLGSAFTLLFFMTSFGWIFISDLQKPRPKTDFGMGFAIVLFVPPLLLTLLLALISSLTLFFLKPGKAVNSAVDLISRILFLLVLSFGILCMIGTIIGIYKHW